MNLEEIKNIVENKEKKIKKDAAILNGVISILKGYQAEKNITNEEVALSLTKVVGELFGDYTEVIINSVKNKEFAGEEITKEIFVKSVFLSLLCIMTIARNNNNIEEFLDKLKVLRIMINEDYEYIKEYLYKIKELNKKQGR